MTEPPSPDRPAGPRPLPVRWYVALVAGVCVLMAVLGAVWKNNGRDLAGEAGMWAGWVVVFGVLFTVCAVIARRVGNPTAPVVCGILLGMGAMAVGEEVGRQIGGVWETVCKYLAFFLVYFIWVGAIHWRIAGRRTLL